MEEVNKPNTMDRPTGSGFGANQSENDLQYSRERSEKKSKQRQGQARQNRDGDTRYTVELLSSVKLLLIDVR